jgi:hypothetical protein
MVIYELLHFSFLSTRNSRFVKLNEDGGNLWMEEAEEVSFGVIKYMHHKFQTIRAQ